MDSVCVSPLIQGCFLALRENWAYKNASREREGEIFLPSVCQTEREIHMKGQTGNDLAGAGGFPDGLHF
jgi:hypothetical protein